MAAPGPADDALSFDEGADVDDHLLAHVDTPFFQRRRAHMWQDDHLAALGELAQLGIDCRLVLEQIERRAAEFFMFQLLDQRMLVDDLAARRVDDQAVGCIRARRRAESRWKVAGVEGQLTEMISMRASIWSMLSQ